MCWHQKEDYANTLITAPNGLCTLDASTISMQNLNNSSSTLKLHTEKDSVHSMGKLQLCLSILQHTAMQHTRVLECNKRRKALHDDRPRELG